MVFQTTYIPAFVQYLSTPRRLRDINLAVVSGASATIKNLTLLLRPGLILICGISVASHKPKIYNEARCQRPDVRRLRPGLRRNCQCILYSLCLPMLTLLFLAAPHRAGMTVEVEATTCGKHLVWRMHSRISVASLF